MWRGESRGGVDRGVGSQPDWWPRLYWGFPASAWLVLSVGLSGVSKIEESASPLAGRRATILPSSLPSPTKPAPEPCHCPGGPPLLLMIGAVWPQLKPPATETPRWMSRGPPPSGEHLKTSPRRTRLGPG